MIGDLQETAETRSGDERIRVAPDVVELADHLDDAVRTTRVAFRPVG